MARLATARRNFMMKVRSNRRSPWQCLAMTAVAVAALGLGATGAFAGECPADQRGVDLAKEGASMPKDVTDELLAAIDLSKEAVMLDDRMFRLRRLVVQPGGIVPWHSHADRPALIYVVSGEITEHASTCAVPIDHQAGEVSMESIGLSHWWQNNGSTPAVLLSADILHVEAGDESMM
jgi:quercetin dioxygenase-like cupin family protein